LFKLAFTVLHRIKLRPVFRHHWWHDIRMCACIAVWRDWFVVSAICTQWLDRWPISIRHRSEQPQQKNLQLLTRIVDDELVPSDQTMLLTLLVPVSRHEPSTMSVFASLCQCLL